MAATVGKYVLKAADNAADWVQGIKFGKNADIVTDNDAVLVVDLDGLERQLSYSKTGRDKLMEPGGIIDPTTDLDRSQQYANFVEFAESTDQPIHMPIVKVDADGEIDLADGSVSLAALRDAGLKEIPVVIPKDEIGAIPGHMLSRKGMVTAKNADIPVTKPADYTPKKLTPEQQRVFNYNVEQAGFPAHTAKSIALGELPMDSASRAARRAEGGFTEDMYHGGSGGIINLDINRDGFWNSRNPIVSNMYTAPMPDMNSAMYKLAFNPSQSGDMSAGQLGWRELDGLNTDIVLPGGKIVNTVDDLDGGRAVTGQEFEDTNDLARLAKGMGLSAMEITDLVDPGHNSKAARNAFQDSVAKVNPGATQAQLDNEWSKFLEEYEEWGDTNIVVVDPTTVRSATGAAFDPRNRVMPNIMGGSGALAIGLGASNESEAGVPDAAAKAVNKAINVRVDKKAGIDYADEILSGNKTFETRNTDSLRPYVGQRVGIARTGAGEAKALGSAEIGEPIVVDEATFRTMQDQHLVPPGTDFDIKPGGTKYLYPVSNPERFDTPKSVGHGIVSRKILGGGTGAAVGLSASDTSQAAVEQLNSIMEGRLTPGFKSRATQAQQVISGKAPINSTQQVVYDTMAAAADPNPDVGSITGVPNNPISQGAGKLGFALQNFGSNMQSAGPAGWMVGTAIEDLGNIATRAAYGESKATDPAMAVLDFLALTPGSYMSQGMRTAMADKDIAPMIFRELLK